LLAVLGFCVACCLVAHKYFGGESAKKPDWEQQAIC